MEVAGHKTPTLGSFNAKQRAPPIKGAAALCLTGRAAPSSQCAPPWLPGCRPPRLPEPLPYLPSSSPPPCYRTHALHGPSKQPAPPIRRSRAPGGRRPAAPRRPTADGITAPTNLPNQAWGTTRPSPARARPVPAAGSLEFGRTATGRCSRTTLQAPNSLQGLNCKPRVYL
jgi:hypothetical protein